MVVRGLQEVPEKSKSHVFLECARLEEFTGNMECARQILERARVETKSEWKVNVITVIKYRVPVRHEGERKKQSRSRSRSHQQTWSKRLFVVMVLVIGV